MQSIVLHFLNPLQRSLQASAILKLVPASWSSQTSTSADKKHIETYSLWRFWPLWLKRSQTHRFWTCMVDFIGGWPRGQELYGPCQAKSTHEGAGFWSAKSGSRRATEWGRSDLKPQPCPSRGNGVVRNWGNYTPKNIQKVSSSVTSNIIQYSHMLIILYKLYIHIYLIYYIVFTASSHTSKITLTYFLDLPGARTCTLPAPSSCSICMTLDCLIMFLWPIKAYWTPSNIILNSTSSINLKSFFWFCLMELFIDLCFMPAQWAPSQAAFMPGSSHPTWGDGAVAWPWDVPAEITLIDFISKLKQSEHFSNGNEHDA